MNHTEKQTLPTVYTDASGLYQFQNIAPGQYAVQFSRPTSWVFSLEHQGADTSVDSDVDSSGVTAYFALLTNDSLNWLDAGLFSG